jgi:hypothetical protein
MPKPARLIAFFLLVLAQNSKVDAGEWKTKCGRSIGEVSNCTHIKGDAVLMGRQGSLNTIVFPNGERRQYFYTGGAVQDLEGLKVRKFGDSWFSANGYIDEDGRLCFQLPSGNVFMWVSAFPD